MNRNNPGILPARFAHDEKPPDALLARVREKIERVPAARGAWRARRAIALMAAVTWTTAMVVGASLFAYHQYAGGLGVAAESATRLAGVFIVLVALACAATFVGARRGLDGFGSRAGTLLATAILVAPVYSMLVLVNPVHAGDLAVAGVAISPWGARCVVLASIIGAGIMFGFSWALRRSVPSANRPRGAALGAATGAWTGVALFAFCPSAEAQHLLLGHVLPLAAFTCLGIVLMPRVLRP